MPICPSCRNEVAVLCAEDGLCRNCSDCCRPDASSRLRDLRLDV